ncbi:BAR-domain-containing protein [Rhizophagus irregularis]|nr:BAR-domain-containing protein [Rhizophagus irregularis]
MSWKGTKKTFERLPQNIRVKTGLGTATRDIQFDDVLNRFNELHTGTEKLYKDAIKFRDGISHMLNHQCNTSDILVELYNPIVGKKETESTVRRTTTPVQSMKAVEEFKDTMSDLRDILLPELDRVDKMVVLPSKDFIDVVKLIKKTIAKRDHKKVDFDRYTNNVKKLQDKKDKSANDEKSLIKAEEHLTKATEEYEHYNELVNKELPIFFEYRAHFIEPVVSNFYHLQVKIYRILYEKMERLISDTGYFDVQSDIVEHYKERKEEVNQQIETHLTLFKNKKKSKKESHHDNDSDELTDSKHSDTNNHGSEEDAPPPYSSTTGRSSASISSSNPKLYPVQKKAPPPLPPHNSKPKSVQYVRALYDYEAQAEGDLSFKKGDKIEVITRKDDVNEWWKGKLNGKIGDFPGNYVEDW